MHILAECVDFSRCITDDGEEFIDLEGSRGGCLG